MDERIEEVPLFIAYGGVGKCQVPVSHCREQPFDFVLFPNIVLVGVRNKLSFRCKETGQEKFNSFVYRDFVPDAAENYSMGQILFDMDHLWIRDDVLYFVETYYGRINYAVFGAYDLAESKAVYFKTIEHAEVVMVQRGPDKGQVSVLINPMGYQPLELCTIDDKTMEVLNVTKLELPNEYLTRKDSVYEADIYYLWKADMDQDRVAIMFGDIIDSNKMDDGLATSIMVVYDRTSGDTIWRGRFTMDSKYEISSFNIT